MVIGNKAIRQAREKLFSTVNLCLFNRPQVQALHCSLGLSHKVDVLYLTLMEHDSSVRRIVANRCRNIEALGQFCVNKHFLRTIQTFCKFTLYAFFRSPILRLNYSAWRVV